MSKQNKCLDFSLNIEVKKNRKGTECYNMWKSKLIIYLSVFEQSICFDPPNGSKIPKLLYDLYEW